MLVAGDAAGCRLEVPEATRSDLVESTCTQPIGGNYNAGDRIETVVFSGGGPAPSASFGYTLTPGTAPAQVNTLNLRAKTAVPNAWQ